MVSLLSILRRLAESRGTSDRYWQDKRRRMEDERARRERQRQLEELIKRKKRRATLLSLKRLEPQPVTLTLTNVPINEILGFEPEKIIRKKRMSKKEFATVYRAIFEDVTKPKVKYKDPDRW